MRIQLNLLSIIVLTYLKNNYIADGHSGNIFPQVIKTSGKLSIFSNRSTLNQPVFIIAEK